MRLLQIFTKKSQWPSIFSIYSHYGVDFRELVRVARRVELFVHPESTPHAVVAARGDSGRQKDDSLLFTPKPSHSATPHLKLVGEGALLHAALGR
jgi:hypothetical protein